MPSQKGSFLPVLGVILLLVTVGAGGYFFGIRQISTKEPSQTSQPLP